MDLRGDDPQAALIARVRDAMEGRVPASGSLAHQVDALFAAEQPRLYGVCRRLVGDPEMARELAQEAMLVAWRKLAEFDGRVSFRTWLYGIARHLSFNALRKRGDLLTEDGLLEATGEEAGALSRLQREEREGLVAAAAQAVLDPTEQEVVHLRYVEQLPQERITELLGIEEASGARGVLQRCRRKLRRELLRRLEALGHGTSFVRGTT